MGGMRPFLEVEVRAKALREAEVEEVLSGLVQAGRVLLRAYGPGSVLYEVAEDGREVALWVAEERWQERGQPPFEDPTPILLSLPFPEGGLYLVEARIRPFAAVQGTVRLRFLRGAWGSGYKVEWLSAPSEETLGEASGEGEAYEALEGIPFPESLLEAEGFSPRRHLGDVATVALSLLPEEVDGALETFWLEDFPFPAAVYSVERLLPEEEVRGRLMALVGEFAQEWGIEGEAGEPLLEWRGRDGEMLRVSFPHLPPPSGVWRG